MTTNSTELVFILDRSGSMAGLESDTIGGFNSMMQKQKETPGQARVTTVLFDNHYELLHDRLDLQAVQAITNKEYNVRGSTALLDAMGRTIQKMDGVMAATALEYRADKILFVIITDGMENASHRFTPEQVASLVNQRREMGWEFIFLGANMDAITVARSMGIAQERAETFHNDQKGVDLNFKAVTDAASSFRGSGQIKDNWAYSVRDYHDKKEKGKK